SGYGVAWPAGTTTFVIVVLTCVSMSAWPSESWRDDVPVPFHVREVSTPARPLTTRSCWSSTFDQRTVVVPLSCDLKWIDSVVSESNALCGTLLASRNW